MEEEIIRHLERFVSFRTFAGEHEKKRQCLDWIHTTFLKPAVRGPEALRPEWETCNLTPQFGEVEGCPYLLLAHKSPKLLFFAHIDVVPGEEHQFTLRQESDRLFARGAKDMKGATLPFLLAYRDACARGEMPLVSVLLTSDEETAGPTIPTLLKKGKLPVPCAFTPDTGASPHIVVETKGVVWANLIAQGRGAHGALPWEGENPIPLLAQAIQRLQEAFPPGSDSEWQMTVTPTQLRGSDARNKVPDEAHCSLDIRYPSFAPRRMESVAPRFWKSFVSQRDGASDGKPQGAKVGQCMTAEAVLAKIRHYLPPGCRLELILSTPPLKTDPKHPMVQLVKRLAEEVAGKEVPIGREHGATDARYFGAAGIPAFLYGPVGSGIHGSEEWVSLSSMLQHYEISKRLLSSLP